MLYKIQLYIGASIYFIKYSNEEFEYLVLSSNIAITCFFFKQYSVKSAL